MSGLQVWVLVVSPVHRSTHQVSSRELDLLAVDHWNRGEVRHDTLAPHADRGVSQLFIFPSLTQSLTWAEERWVVDDLLVAWTALFGADLDPVHVFGPTHAAIKLQYKVPWLSESRKQRLGFKREQ